MDGLDLALCQFREVGGRRWEGEILRAATRPYSSVWRRKLRFAHLLSGRELMHLHAEFGHFLGQEVQAFLQNPDPEEPVPFLVASHGHTLFHEPERSFTFQLGSGAHLSAIIGKPVVCDFRSGDVALGGQGAPLVPAGEMALFPEYRAFLNLGGFANVSLRPENDTLVAWDVCGANYILNALARRLGLEFDAHGALAAQGRLLPHLDESLEKWPYYFKPPPKSLGAEQAEEILSQWLPPETDVRDLLHTWCQHIARRISADLGPYARKAPLHVLVTGGGALNSFLMNKIRQEGEKNNLIFEVPEQRILEFKEAYIFAYLGLLRWLQRPNALASVTGARRDSVQGALYMP
ncbi:MAG: anhydro-N-acetylmuramic acid kinase [Flavobacteriales bacterium]|nr:anhydro-N-acetylmuramic acid kinase [Flavobacteriales bacterium]